MKKAKRERKFDMSRADVSLPDYIRIKLGTLMRHWKLLILLGMALGCLFCGMSYANSLKSSSMTMSLNYEEAASGLTPNSLRFNIHEFKIEEVLDNAIAYAGLTDQVTASELSDCISVKATNTKSVDGSSTFISTSYRITYTNNGCIKGRDAATMISLICKAYKDYFMSNYADNQSILTFTDDRLMSDEYLLRVEGIELRANQLLRYANQRLKENKNFKGADGTSFSAIQKRLQNFFDYDLQNVYSYVLESGIATDKDELLNTLDYKQRMNWVSYDKYMAAYNMDNKGISMYDEAMSASILIPTVDKSDKYYMSRTKTAMDYLASNADSKLDSATYLLSTIEYDSYIIDKVNSGTDDKSVKEKAESMIDTMESYLESLSVDLKKLDVEYIRQKTHDYLTFSSNEVSLTSRFNIVKSAEYTFICMICIILVYFVAGHVNGRKKRNEE